MALLYDMQLIEFYFNNSLKSVAMAQLYFLIKNKSIYCDQNNQTPNKIKKKICIRFMSSWYFSFCQKQQLNYKYNNL